MYSLELQQIRALQDVVRFPHTTRKLCMNVGNLIYVSMIKQTEMLSRSADNNKIVVTLKLINLYVLTIKNFFTDCWYDNI